MASTYNNVNSTVKMPSHNLPSYIGANGTSGQFLTSGSNGTSWSSTTDNVLVAKNNPPELEVKGRLVLNGQDVEERLKTIEKVLMIPERDVKMEAKYPSLKKKYDEYIKELSKYRMWESIKGDNE